LIKPEDFKVNGGAIDAGKVAKEPKLQLLSFKSLYFSKPLS
jgi:hypothetical protein